MYNSGDSGHFLTKLDLIFHTKDYTYNFLTYHVLKKMFPLGFEPRTSRVLGERDDRYTMETYFTKK